MAKSKLKTVGKELRVIEGNINRLIDWYYLIDCRWLEFYFCFADVPRVTLFRFRKILAFSIFRGFCFPFFFCSFFSLFD